jgi:hypothetical protein
MNNGCWRCTDPLPTPPCKTHGWVRTALGPGLLRAQTTNMYGHQPYQHLTPPYCALKQWQYLLLLPEINANRFGTCQLKQTKEITHLYNISTQRQCSSLIKNILSAGSRRRLLRRHGIRLATHWWLGRWHRSSVHVFDQQMEHQGGSPVPCHEAHRRAAGPHEGTQEGRRQLHSGSRVQGLRGPHCVLIRPQHRCHWLRSLRQCESWQCGGPPGSKIESVR